MKELDMSDISGTVAFLQQIISWWNIVSVKAPNKGTALCQQECNPIRQDSTTDSNLLCLRTFELWLTAWEEMDLAKN